MCLLGYHQLHNNRTVSQKVETIKLAGYMLQNSGTAMGPQGFIAVVLTVDTM